MVIGCIHAPPPPDMQFVLLDDVGNVGESVTSILEIFCQLAKKDFLKVYNHWCAKKAVFIQTNRNTSEIDHAPSFALIFLAVVSLVAPLTIVKEMK
jgi:hypothetical protein